MRKFFISLLFLSFVFNSHANSEDDKRHLIDGDWISPGFKDSYGNYLLIKLSSFELTDYPIIQIFTRTNYVNPSSIKLFKAKSSQQLVEFNCQDDSFRIMVSKLYEKYHNEGRLIFNESMDHKHASVKKNSVIEGLLGVVCDAQELKIRSIVEKTINLKKKFPKDALKLKLEGEVTLSITIDKNGNLLELTPITSSGHELLDRSAVNFVRESIPFPLPEMANLSNNANFTFVLPIKFSLE